MGRNIALGELRNFGGMIRGHPRIFCSTGAIGPQALRATDGWGGPKLTITEPFLSGVSAPEVNG